MTRLFCDLRMPPHPNVFRALHHFVDEVPGKLVSHVDTERAMFIVFERYPISLSNLLRHRTSMQQFAINDTKMLAEHEVLHIAIGLARGLLHIHQSRIAHRNIKPDNIYLATSAPSASVMDSAAVCASRPIIADFDSCFDFAELPG